MHVCVCVCVYVCVCVCMCACVCVRACVHVCMHVYVHAYVRTCMYTHVYTVGTVWTDLAQPNVCHLKLVPVEHFPQAAVKQLHSTTQRAL